MDFQGHISRSLRDIAAVLELLFVYVAAREATEEIGGARMRRLFFGF